VPGAEQQVDFYVLEEPSGSARLRTACRIVEKAYLADSRVLVWLPDPEALRAFDDLLWTFGDRSFVPHELLQPGSKQEAPVLLSADALPTQAVDVIVNLCADVPACAELAPRIVEIIDGDPERRQAGRNRFRAYKERGLQPASHNLTNDAAP
jgi:DNA polymerase III subunit chi